MRSRALPNAFREELTSKFHTAVLCEDTHCLLGEGMSSPNPLGFGPEAALAPQSKNEMFSTQAWSQRPRLGPTAWPVLEKMNYGYLTVPSRSCMGQRDALE